MESSPVSLTTEQLETLVSQQSIFGQKHKAKKRRVDVKGSAIRFVDGDHLNFNMFRAGIKDMKRIQLFYM